MVILAANNWPTNGHLIADVAKLYLDDSWTILDPTYGANDGVWWKIWKPKHLVGKDMKLDGSDFTNMRYESGIFDAVAFDPPYKLNGTDQGEGERYGVDIPMRWQDKIQLILDGVTECARVTREILLVKCQDQVCSGRVIWQTDLITECANQCGLDKINRFDYYGGYRPQPMAGRKQKHPHGRGSTLLVFRKSTRAK